MARDGVITETRIERQIERRGDGRKANVTVHMGRAHKLASEKSGRLL